MPPAATNSSAGQEYLRSPSFSGISFSAGRYVDHSATGPPRMDQKLRYPCYLGESARPVRGAETHTPPSRRAAMSSRAARASQREGSTSTQRSIACCQPLRRPEAEGVTCWVGINSMTPQRYQQVRDEPLGACLSLEVSIASVPGLLVCSRCWRRLACSAAITSGEGWCRWRWPP